MCAAFSGVLHAEIDSGGGFTVLGGGSNHSSIGAPFETDGSAIGLIEIIYPLEAPPDPTIDADGNGLPDSWEVIHFGMTNSDTSADADGDGTSNLLEYLAGTDPRSPFSVFRPSSNFQDGHMVVVLPTVTGRRYRVWGTENLGDAWSIHDTLIGDGTDIELMYPLSETQKYFIKIEILIPDI